jgi:hypothetical protein
MADLLKQLYEGTLPSSSARPRTAAEVEEISRKRREALIFGSRP